MSKDQRARQNTSWAVLVAVAGLLAGCVKTSTGKGNELASTQAEPAKPNCSEEHDGLVLVAPPVIASDSQGAVTYGGSGPLVVRWCGEGIVVVRTVELVAPGSLASREYELARELATLGPGQELTMEIHAPAEPGTLEVIALAVDEEGREHQGSTTLETVDDPERSASRERCLADGGQWGPRGMAGIESCDRPTKDAGKRCLSTADCEGACIDVGDEALAGTLPQGVEVPSCSSGQEPRLVVGECDDRTMRFGCHPRLQEVRVECVSPGHERRKHNQCVD